ncbi:hypothetical protein OS189_14605 [Sulfitobacter sp. F26169L]|uniref:hypothetical protein n=1 Tax=Sulfitobacter sp. F26169L TaxID=2996015 RepID=UPI002260DDC1|nr:hypothetical protein [Sulfitobacter sp. F26169L]MCX7567574.1 hypothetical protein [Sulfitobacter sp. F26169L]
MRPKERPLVQDEVVQLVQVMSPVLPKAASDASLNDAQKATLLGEIVACWSVPKGAPQVKLGFSLDRSGKPKTGSIREISHVGGAKTAVQSAFAAAKRAVLRCGRDGYTLPVEKYQQWRDIELTFNPERTSLR